MSAPHAKNRVAAPVTIAVLPFQNLGSDKEYDFLRMALPDEVATTLSSVRTLSIRPFASTGKYVGGDVDVAGCDRLSPTRRLNDQRRLQLDAAVGAEQRLERKAHLPASRGARHDQDGRRSSVHPCSGR